MSIFEEAILPRIINRKNKPSNRNKNGANKGQVIKNNLNPKIIA